MTQTYKIYIWRFHNLLIVICITYVTHDMLLTPYDVISNLFTMYKNTEGIYYPSSKFSKNKNLEEEKWWTLAGSNR